MSAVARRYARAAADVAHAEGGMAALEALVEAIRAFSSAYETSDELRQLLVNPALREERDRTLRHVLDATVPDAVARRLIERMVHARRLRELPDVARALRDIADARRAVSRAEVTTAIPLTDPLRQRIARALADHLGKKVEIEADVDPSILGGLVCRIGDLTIDNSLRHQLERMRRGLSSDDRGAS